VKINWTEQAEADLKEVFDFIAKDSKKYAHFQISKLRNCTKALKKQPYIGKRNEEFGDDKVRELVEGNYRIIYRIKSQERIDILLIHHGARDLKRRMKKP